ncbi:tRNA-dihydrouridine(16/17) synthase [NAD(P)(+)]-like [Contarinia nasturtii]|uniref:tRNA-dihydrouridine(16/17) synthase [NAD(P)(+)]-like n=1 Tax=Contarinia nasturtii TaxID=265458 RepID=UPI0012D3AED7|nr:tRNA-dihydrouridine(16/17) synthase [NAD(P)(+)]-like [Contarinia nasturtii]XP_031623254.1 tRNA-dihydrouridine(16/17) synthase [NAD(P)(+)]-like [Contarinia nasturtii]XP_031623255.1 tRNA-dihydrouridine(16/17) synthase [NAD(P)(+)]-like [Contarinia nasturtii]
MGTSDETKTDDDGTTSAATIFPIPASQRVKRQGMDFYENTLGAPKYVVAPMVDQSELAWRLLSRRHGAQLCYSPMYHSNVFIQDPKYREQALQSCSEDRPLIIQFCGNDPKILLEASLIAQDHCDAIDINLGCPQAIAKRGHYGSFLQDEWQLLQKIVSTLHKGLAVPVTCKIRRFNDLSKTIKYAQMLANAGCQMLTVHGRTREQKGPFTGVADWNYIKAVRDSVSVPVLANGNILSVEDIDDCIRETNVVGVMTAEGNLHNPAIFERNYIPVTWDLANEYLDIVEKYECPRGYVRGHIFKMLHHLLALKQNQETRDEVATAQTIAQFRSIVNRLKAIFEPYHTGQAVWTKEDEKSNDYNLSLPPWICQPYIRMPPEKHIEYLAQKEKEASEREKIDYFDEDGRKISKNTMKRLKKAARKSHAERLRQKQNSKFEICNGTKCANPTGLKCDHKMCRQCCRDKCHTDNLECEGHKCRVEPVKRKNICPNNTEISQTDQPK